MADFFNDARYNAAARVLDEAFACGIVLVLGAGRRPDDKRVFPRRYVTGEFCSLPAHLRARAEEYEHEIAVLIDRTQVVFSAEICLGCRFSSWTRLQADGLRGETICNRGACDNWLMTKDQVSRSVPDSVGAILDHEVDCS